jgi:hypothetical protein
VPRSRCQASTKQVPGKCQADAKQVPSMYRGGKQPDEAMPSSRGDARAAAERARTGGRRAPVEINGPRPPDSKVFCGRVRG